MELYIKKMISSTEEESEQLDEFEEDMIDDKVFEEEILSDDQINEALDFIVDCKSVHLLRLYPK